MTTLLQHNVEAKLAVLDGPEWDSSDDDAPNTISSIKTTKTTRKAPVNTKKAKLLQRLTVPAIVKESNASRVIYLGHIPKGFEEAELHAFLGQFGQVTQLQLSRSKKTGNPRGFAFVEFVSRDVATIVAETLSGYLIDSKRMVCHVLPKDKVRKELFSGRPFQRIDWTARHRAKVNAPKSNGKLNNITKKLLQRETQKRAKLLELGIDYDFPGYAASSIAFPSKVVEEPQPPNNQDKVTKVINTKTKELKTVKTNKRKAQELPGGERKTTIKSPKQVVPLTDSNVLANTPLVKELDNKNTPTPPIQTVSFQTTSKKSNKKAKTMTVTTPVPIVEVMKQKSILAEPPVADEAPIISQHTTPPETLKTTKADKKKRRSPGSKIPRFKSDSLLPLSAPAKTSTPSSAKIPASAKTPTSEKTVPSAQNTPSTKTTSSAKTFVPGKTPPSAIVTSSDKTISLAKTYVSNKTSMSTKTPSSASDKSPTSAKTSVPSKTPLSTMISAPSKTLTSAKTSAPSKTPPSTMISVPITAPLTLTPTVKKAQVSKKAAKQTPPPKTPITKKVTIMASPATEEPVKKVTPAQTRSRGKTPVKDTKETKNTPSAQKVSKSAKDFTPPTTRSKRVAPKTEIKAMTMKKTKATRRGSN